MNLTTNSLAGRAVWR